MFTKQHYKAIANIIKEAKEDYRVCQDSFGCGTPSELVLSMIEARLSDYFAKDNPCFDAYKFFEACTIE